MEPVRYYLEKDPWTALVFMINDVMLYQLQPGSTTLVSMASLGPKKTQFVIETHQSTDPISSMPKVERFEYQFDRLDLSTFFKSNPVLNISSVRVPYSTLDLVDLISEATGIVFATDDFIHRDVVAFNEANDYILEANPKSLRWVGFLRFRLTNTLKIDISSTPTLNLPGVNGYSDGNPTGELQEGYFYTAGFDFTPHREYLGGIGKNQFFGEPAKLAAIIQSITGYMFTYGTTLEPKSLTWEIMKGEPRHRVRYNGPPIEPYTNRIGFNRVLVLDLSLTYSRDVVGTLVLDYN